MSDGVILRLIGKWLNAGVLEDGSPLTPEHGAPQGGVLSPLLSNLFLHYVLDQWFDQEVRPRLKRDFAFQAAFFSASAGTSSRAERSLSSVRRLWTRIDRPA